jgi:hypothetical protein
MADLKIPNLNMKSDKYIFKKKLSLKRKSKKRLFTESAFLFSLSLLLVYINYLIPNKNFLLENFPSTFNNPLMPETQSQLTNLFMFNLSQEKLISFSNLSSSLVLIQINEVLDFINNSKFLHQEFII